MTSKRVLLAGLVVPVIACAAIAGSATASSAGKPTLTGAGSSFVAPLVSLWTKAYKSKAKINYSAIGSGGGIQAISARQVDFGASDAPLTKDQFANCHGCVQIPWALSGTSIPYNIKGVGKTALKLTGPVLADIYLGKIKSWSDKRIKALNKGVKLPKLKITPVHRSDGSGTTYNVTDYLSKVSAEFKSKVGRGTQVSWPVGIGGDHSSGMAAAVAQTNGAIGYVDVEYSLKNGLGFAKMKNRAGVYNYPTLNTIKAAAATVKKVPGSNEMHIVDPPGSQKRAYPISTYTYVILPKKTSKANPLKTFVGWAITKGQTVKGAQQERYVDIGDKVRTASKSTLKKIHS